MACRRPRASRAGRSAPESARAVLKDALVSAKAAEERLRIIVDEMRVAMFLTGSASPRELAGQKLIFTGPAREWALETEVI